MSEPLKIHVEEEKLRHWYELVQKCLNPTIRMESITTEADLLRAVLNDMISRVKVLDTELKYVLGID